MPKHGVPERLSAPLAQKGSALRAPENFQKTPAPSPSRESNASATATLPPSAPAASLPYRAPALRIDSSKPAARNNHWPRPRSRVLRRTPPPNIPAELTQNRPAVSPNRQ